MKNSDIMQVEVVTITPEASLKEVMLKLEDWDVRHLPVVEDGRLVGIISDRDMREFLFPIVGPVENREIEEHGLERSVAEVMAQEVVSVGPEEDLRTAIEVLLHYGIGAVPVVDDEDDRLLGIISYVDILKVAKDLLGEED